MQGSTLGRMEGPEKRGAGLPGKVGRLGEGSGHALRGSDPGAQHRACPQGVLAEFPWCDEQMYPRGRRRDSRCPEAAQRVAARGKTEPRWSPWAPALLTADNVLHLPGSQVPPLCCETLLALTSLSDGEG